MSEFGHRDAPCSSPIWGVGAPEMGGGELRGEYEERWKFADKPGSVVDSHSSGPDVTAKL